MRRMAIGTLTALALCAVTASASSPRTTTTATIQLNVPADEIAAYTSGSGVWPTIGDSVTFSVTYPRSVDKYGPRVQVLCYQNDALVYAEAGPYYQSFLLGGASSPWLNNGGGPAVCRADLYYWTYQGGQQFNWLASTSFNVGG